SSPPRLSDNGRPPQPWCVPSASCRIRDRAIWANNTSQRCRASAPHQGNTMTTASEGAALTRIGPQTLMGDLMRQYWIPAALSSEVARDGASLRLMLLGEKLIAFRDSAGRVGVMDHRCPHRCASLFLGRNEANGIRCVYHGWKFDTEGNCIDMPN